jgi:hypothetical protein
VEAKELGQGVLVRRSDACYLLTANHVVQGSLIANVSASTGKLRIGEAEVIARFTDDDLALLRVMGAIAGECGGDWLAFRGDLSARLARRTTGSMPYVFPDGGAVSGLGRLPFAVTDLGPDFVRVTPLRADDQIEQGRSGSLLTLSENTGERPIGLLLSVDNSGMGKALRWDRVLARMESFFEKRVGAVAVVSPASAKVPDAAAAGFPARENKLLASSGASVVDFNRRRVPDSGSVNSLIGPPGDGPAWKVELGAAPVEVVFQLPGNAPVVLSEVGVMVSAETAPQERPKELEILLSQDGVLWIPVKTMTMLEGDLFRKASFHSSRARLVKLRVYSSWGARSVALRQVMVR